VLATALSPLAVRFPLFDPDRMLERWLPLYRPLFGMFGGLLWLAVVGTGLFLMVQHWGDLTEDITDRVLAPENLLMLVLVFPLLKAFHEFGHACAVKAWGGEVHEMGIMLLVLMPIPYVDASSANAFPQKYRRVLVGSAGMIVEVFIGSLALLLWLELEPGVLRAVMYNVMLIAGISTVLFNANPLLRFDGYYILADLIEIPNLRARANQFVLSSIERRLFGVKVPESEARFREKAWFVFFSVAAFIYRLFITFVISIFVAGQYFIVGILLAIFAVLMSVVLPVVKGILYVAAHPRLRRHRLRAATVSGLLAGLLVLLVFGVPVPAWTNAQGVVSVPDNAIVRPRANGFVAKVVVPPGAHVQKGDLLIEGFDPMLPLEIELFEARRRELEVRYQSEWIENRVRAQITLEQLKTIDADLARARERLQDLAIRSPADGVFHVAAPQDLPQRYFRQGQQIGYVLPDSVATARVMVSQQAADLVRNRTELVEVRLAENLDDVMRARVRREVPAAHDRLPSLALAQSGGGTVAMDPRENKEARALQTHFEFELELPDAKPVGVGGRIYVRFEHGSETIAAQVYRTMRQLFLERFAV
jgi:putative peptide zinc metalloprotease protein